MSSNILSPASRLPRRSMTLTEEKRESAQRTRSHESTSTTSNVPVDSFILRCPPNLITVIYLTTFVAVGAYGVAWALRPTHKDRRFPRGPTPVFQSGRSVEPWRVSMSSYRTPRPKNTPHLPPFNMNTSTFSTANVTPRRTI